MADLIDGKAFAAKIRAEVKEDSDKLISQKQVDPCLAVVLVGENPASKVYVGQKTKMAAECNIKTKDFKLEASTDQETLLKLIDELNNDSSVHGILVQLPLPSHIDSSSVLNAINPEKDVDGFHPVNVGKMIIGEDSFLPCTPHGIIELLKRCNIETKGKHAVVIGRSNIVGTPIANMLFQKKLGANATVTICHTGTKNLKDFKRFT